MNLGYHIYVCQCLTYLEPHFEPLDDYELPDTYSIQFLVCSYFWKRYHSISRSQALLLVITFKKIRYSLNKREQCSFDGCWYNITLFIRHTACNFFQRAWQRHELWRKKTWLQGEMMIPTAEFVILFCLWLFSEPCKILIFSAGICHRSFILFLLREWE